MALDRRSAATVCNSAALLAVVALASAARAAELVVDGGFDDPTLSAWTLQSYGASTLDWSAVDAAGDGGSGSLRVLKPIAAAPGSARVRQCILVPPGAELELSARIRVPSQVATGDAFFLLQWWSGTDCTGDYLLELQPTVPAPPADTWTAIGPYVGTVPATAHSAFVFAGAAVTLVEGSPLIYEIDYDDVSVVPEPGAAGGVAALVALACAAAGRRRRG